MVDDIPSNAMEGESEHPVNTQKSDKRKYKYSFAWFALIASLNHSLNYVVNSYATSLLNRSLGGLILGIC